VLLSLGALHLLRQSSHTPRVAEKSAWQSFAPVRRDGTTIRTM
jgi:hypothetical protein